jgi:hypothetical protein
MSIEIGKLTRLPLGIQGENNSRVIEVDVSDWLKEWPTARVDLMVRRPGEKEYYPADTTTVDGILRWRITRADVLIAGKGEAQFILADQGDVELRSRTVETMIAWSIRGTEGNAPPPEAGWVSQVLSAAHDASVAVEKMPIIGENKNWWIWNAPLGEFVDSGVLAEGRDGTDAQDSVLVCRVAFDDFIGEYCDTSFNAVDKAVSDGKACFLISETGVVYSYSGVVREFGESYHKFMRQVFTGMDFNEEYYLLSHPSKLTFGAKAPPVVPVEPVVNIGPCELYWEDLNEYDDEQKAILLEAGKPVFAYWVQSVFDGLAGSSAVLTIGGVDYTVRGFGEIKDSLMYKDGGLQLCRKISDTGDELRTSGYGYETIPCDDLYNVIDYIELPCQPNDIFSKTLASVSYAECGAYLDGIHDDYEAMYRAHFIGNQTGCDVIQHGGTIYKVLSGWLIVDNHNVDLSGSKILIDEYNRYGYYWLNAPTRFEDEGLPLRSEMVEYSDRWYSADTGFPANGIFEITRPADTTRYDGGEVTSIDRKELVRHASDGLVYSTVIDDAKANTVVRLIRYPETHMTFVGCTLSIDIGFASVAMYFLRCERSDVLIRDFTIDPSRRTTMNTGYRGSVFTLNNCADVTLENIRGINIAGRPTDAYPSGMSGYLLNATCVLNLLVKGCNLLGYWGATGLNGAKNVTFDDCEVNRVDVHDYFANLTVNNCRIYGQTINVGYGKGVVNVTNCAVLTDDVHQIVNLRCDYGGYFEGQINVHNVDAVYKGSGHFDVVSGVTLYSAESAAVTGLSLRKYPGVSVSNVTLHLIKKGATTGYVFNMPSDLETAVEVADKRKVIEYANMVAYDATGTPTQIALCSLDGVVQSQALTLQGFGDELDDLSARLAAIEENAGNLTPVDYLYYSKRTLTFAGANNNIRLTLPYEEDAAIYRATCKLTSGTDAGVTVTDWTVEKEVFDGDVVYIRIPSGAMSSGKVVIFAVYPGSNSGTYEITVERTAETDAYTGEIQVDFA